MKLFIPSDLYSIFLIFDIFSRSSSADSSSISNQTIHSDNSKSGAHFDASRVEEEIKSLKIAAVLNEPFVYRGDNDQLYKGIEFELLKIIAAKENLELSINIVSDSKQIDERTLK